MLSSLSKTFWEVSNNPTILEYEYLYDDLINTEYVNFGKPKFPGLYQTMSSIIWYITEIISKLLETWSNYLSENSIYQFVESFIIDTSPYISSPKIKHIAYLYNKKDDDFQLFNNMSKMVHYCYFANLKKLSLFYESESNWKDAQLIFNLLSHLIHYEFDPYDNYKINVIVGDSKLIYTNILTNQRAKLTINLNYDVDDVDLLLMDEKPHLGQKLPVVNNSNHKKRIYRIKSPTIGNLNKILIDADGLNQDSMDNPIGDFIMEF